MFDILFIFLFMSAWEWALWCPFLTDWARNFSVGRWKRRSLWGKKWAKRCFFPPELASIVFLVNMVKVLFPNCTLTWRVNNYASRQGKGINRKYESIIKRIIIIIALYCLTFSEYFSIWLTVVDWKPTFVENNNFSCVKINLRYKIIQSSQLLRFSLFQDYGNVEK